MQALSPSKLNYSSRMNIIAVGGICISLYLLAADKKKKNSTGSTK
jgi:hypothetical protein